MNQIWSNPSVQRSVLVQNFNSKIIDCLKLTKSDSTEAFKDILIFPGMEYNFDFYDSSISKLYSITGLVESVYNDQIKIKFLNNKSNSSNCSRNNIKPMPACNCILNPPDTSKYDGPNILFIPIMNILNVSYAINKSFNKNKNGEVRVMLLGISATTVKAIIIQMAFFEDNIEEAVKYVDLKAGNIYDIAYESNDGCIYESRAKVISIEEVSDHPCKPGKGYVREHVGCHNSVYLECKCSKDKFMDSPPVKKIKIIVDTSESFTGRFESIMLDTIRDCTLVYNETDIEDNGSNNDNTSNSNTDGCNCNNKPNKNVYTYRYDNCKAAVNGEKVSITLNGNTVETDLNSILKYYLGIE